MVCAYISFCIDCIVHYKSFSVFTNNKPWISKRIKDILHKKKVVFQMGELQKVREINKLVRAEIQKDKLKF